MRVVSTCIRLRQLEGDIKRLKKRFRSVEDDLVYAERLLEAGRILPQTDPYRGFGQHNIFKTRVINTDVRKGKSSGYRLIYEEIESGDDKVIVLLLLYDKKTYDDENKVRIEVKTRLRSPDYPKLT